MAGGHVRVDGEKVAKAAFSLRPGMTLTFPQARRIRVVRVETLAKRRGPASEAQGLYTDLTPVDETPDPRNPRFEGKGRPSARDRRNARLSLRDPLD